MAEGGYVKTKIKLLLSLLAAFVLLASIFQQGEGFTREKLLSQLIHTGLQRWHYSDRQIDDDFSEKAFKEYFSYLDYSKRFFLKSDIDEFSKYKDQVDNQFVSGATLLMDAATQRLEQRINQVMEFYGELLDKPFDFTKDETMELDPDKRDYCSNLEELKKYWRDTLKYRVLLRYISYLRTDEEKKTPGELEEKARKEVLKSFKSIFNRLLQANKNDAFSRYLNSLVQVFDPHTVYFLPVDKESFDMQMSGSFEGIGALLRNEDEYVKVVRLIPGGPSWRQKKLEAGDLIIRVAQAGEEPVDITGMRTVDAVKLIRGKKGTEVLLTVKKPDGQIVEIPIVRDVVILEETFAKSAVLVHEKTGKRFGYILLPGFYNDFGREDGRSSTEDVKKELEKLKAKKVDGVILDLRDNGGGSLMEAVDMSGLFIPKGPVVQVEDKNERVKVLEDQDSEVTYAGPLVVLVNQISASSSEILTAALQDYNRAVVVGSAHSYGKGTVQAMVDLDRIISEKTKMNEPFGALTITIQKFYRVTGESIQLKGITPDIVLPDRYDSFEIGEKHLEYPLEWNSIQASQFEKWRDAPLVSTALVEKSKARVQANPAFLQIREYVDMVVKMQDKTTQSLQLDTVMKQQDRLRDERKKLEKYDVEQTHIKVLPPAEPEKKKSEGLNQIAVERRREWFKDIKKDVFLGEVLEIMNDILQEKK
jgi:carboxyl-terminal processing protease